MEQKRLSTYQFEIASPADIKGVLETIQSLQHPYLLVYIYAYIHNTVISQTLKKELQALKNVRFSFLKSEEKRGAKLLVFGYDGEPYEDNLEAEILSFVHNKYLALQHRLRECKHDLIKKYFHDHLTNVPNVFKLRKDLQECEELTLLDITIDDFKHINSFYGFLVGDYILERVAEYLAKVENATLYKMPGGEFVLLLEKHFSYYDLKEYLQRFYEDLADFYVLYQDIQINLDFTIGACTAHSIENILSKLSIALMYAQKHRLPYFIYEDRLEFENSYKENLDLISHIRQSIKEDNVVAYYQPIIDNQTGAVVKYETLARLVNEKGEVVAPDQFLAISKKIKLYHYITKKMIDSAFEMFADSEYEFSINISKDDIVNSETYEYIIQKLKSSDIADRVIFEFVESDAMKEADRILEFVNEIKRYGAKIAIDDFGSGYSNFSMLINMKVDYIKIDGSLISNIDESWSSLLVVESIVEFAKKLNIQVIAEYVYSSTIHSKVKSLGIEYSQGFYIDKPRIDIKYTAL